MTGGARSGKSRYAVEQALAFAPPRAFVATAAPGDAEMAGRIARHRAERGASFVTVEEPRDLAAALAALPAASGVAVIDCLTLWVSNLLRESDAHLASAVDALAEAVAACRFAVIVVSNEVGSGIVPFDPDLRRYRDWLGHANQRLAAVVDRVVLMVAGLPLVVKPPASAR